MAEVFVSYEATEGLGLAYGVCAALSDLDVRAWMWHIGRQSGVDTFEEIAEQIDDSDVVFIICTSTTKASQGQQREIGQASALGKRLFVLTTSPDYVPLSLINLNYDLATLETIMNVCSKLVPQWRQITSVPSQAMEGQPIPALQVAIGTP